MQGAIAVNEILGGGRYKRRPDGAYLDTKTGQVYPNEESLPKDAKALPQGALETQPRRAPLAARQGPIDPQRFTPRPDGGFTDAQKGYVYPNEDVVPGALPTPDVLTRENALVPPPALSAQPQPQAGGIDSGPAVPSMPMPAPQGAIAQEPKNTWLGNIMSGKGLLAKSAPSEPGSAADIIERMASGQGLLGRQKPGAIAAPMPPTPAISAQPVSMMAPQNGGVDTGAAVPSMPMPQQGAIGEPLSEDRLALLQSSLAQPKTPVATIPSVPGVGTPQAPQAPMADAMGAINLHPPVDRPLVDAAKAADHNPVGAIDVSGDIDRGGDAALASAQPVTHEGDFLQQLAGKVGFGDGTSTESGAESNSRNMGLLRAGLAMMTSAGKPGATALGSLGEGGLYALDASEKEKDREEARDWRKTVFQADQTNKSNALHLDIAKWLTGEAHQKNQDTQAARRNDISEVTANATADWRENQIKDSGRTLNIQQQNADSRSRANNLREQQDGWVRKNYSAQQQNMMDQRYEQDFGNQVRLMGNQVLDPEAVGGENKKAQAASARNFPMSSQGQAFAEQELQRLQAIAGQAETNGDSQSLQQAQSAIAQIVAKFYPNAKGPSGK